MLSLSITSGTQHSTDPTCFEILLVRYALFIKYDSHRREEMVQASDCTLIDSYTQWIVSLDVTWLWFLQRFRRFYWIYTEWGKSWKDYVLIKSKIIILQATLYILMGNIIESNGRIMENNGPAHKKCDQCNQVFVLAIKLYCERRQFWSSTTIFNVVLTMCDLTLSSK